MACYLSHALWISQREGQAHIRYMATAFALLPRYWHHTGQHSRWSDLEAADFHRKNGSDWVCYVLSPLVTSWARSAKYSRRVCCSLRPLTPFLAHQKSPQQHRNHGRTVWYGRSGHLPRSPGSRRRGQRRARCANTSMRTRDSVLTARQELRDIVQALEKQSGFIGHLGR